MASRKPDVDTRAALIEATWALLCERGLANTSVNAILERAGLSKGTFYHWFKSRTALLDAVAEHVLNVALANSRAHVAQAGSGLERLRVFLSAGRAWRLR
ncbi:MAG: helix-turn-helix transcriptional regulator, partial [Alphaproteobacteria bacterium]|nr:helix-turn-helix transcriptional regulator [Alphaproteobacteria bacterium]